MTVDESWSIIHGWLGEHHPAMLPRLRGPADPAALAALEAHTGCRLPEDFKRSYLIHDGSDDVSGPLVGLTLMSLSRISSNWDMWASIVDDDNADLDAECRSHPPGAVKLRYANRGWLPIAGDGQNSSRSTSIPAPREPPGRSLTPVVTT